MTKQDLIDTEEQYGRYNYNAWISERIPLNRSLGDYRDSQCLNISYNPQKSVTTSIIIANLMEHPHTLLRTIYSLKAQTSYHLITEIILVHDGLADIDVFNYIAFHFPIVIQLEVGTVKGPINARLTGAKVATGDILVFLNAHMEVTMGWLPPLLEPILLNKNTVTEPIMDEISRRTFGYQKLQKPEQMAFDWQLEHIYIALDRNTSHNLPKPYASSQLEGRVFAIDRRWFWRLGGWDEGLLENGGDALELSLKVWQCGGSILTVPCSRVGIIYKRDEVEAQKAPNKNPSLQVRKNFKRVVDVWFDEFRLHFYRYNPRLRNLTTESLDEPQDLRRRLKCKSFGWYRSQVAPELRNYYLHAGLADYAVGKIMPLLAPHYCLSIKGGYPVMRMCNSTKYEDWTLTHRCQLRFGQICLSADSDNNVKLTKCTKKVPKHPWKYDYDKKSFVIHGNKCLQIDVDGVALILGTCKSDTNVQRWLFTGVRDSKLGHSADACLNVN
ncbi:putative polypeptide N-acetylgalactosaminyltransferase 11 [Drosophila eugracilis]|uniref:putative polypeptide N-acetylgalactosaminyltransferase 11 n=1 Tax=Drosophila eugracilis TaxID=29029 RepID=UPI0007E8068D|nr:putative polypeptide N-acetylgalactosaminyltransferase 11 [Drosophila eugracilis]